MSVFTKVPELPADPIFGLAAEFAGDQRPEKYTFIKGYFRTPDLETPVLKVVADAEKTLAEQKLKKEYLPIDGDPVLVAEIGHLIFGAQCKCVTAYGAQTVGGTGALFLSGVLATHWTDEIYISDPTWVNHWSIYKLAGLKTKKYPYYADGALQFEGMCHTLENAKKNACVLLHASGHNPTGKDLTNKQWQTLSDLFKEKELYPIFDIAYQGFSQGVEEDVYGVRLFHERGHELSVTYTCAKNFSLYGERVGALYVVPRDQKAIPAIRSQVRKQIRGSYSNPPIHGKAVVKTILSTPLQKKAWIEELAGMRAHVKHVRAMVASSFEEKCPERNWHTIKDGSGLFYFSELSSEQIAYLRKEHGLYLAADGRVNLTGISEKNCHRFVEAFLAAKKIQ